MNVVLSAGLRAEFHVVNHAGHYAFREHAERFNRLAIDFLSPSLSLLEPDRNFQQPAEARVLGVLQELQYECGRAGEDHL